MLIRGDLAFHDYEGVAVDLDERERLVADLGDKNAMILRNHGTLAVGKNVGECFIRLYYPRARVPGADHGAVGRRQHQQPAAGLARDHRRSRARSGLPLAANLLAWPALKRKAYRLDPSFATLRVGRGRRARSERQRYRALAKARLPHFLFEYLDGGSYDEVTLRRNVEDLQAVALQAARAARRFGDRPFDRAVRAALGDAGRPRAGRACRASMRGAAKCRRRRPRRRRTSRSRCRRSAPARSAKSRASGHVLWFQLYFVKDRGFVRDMIARAKEAAAARCCSRSTCRCRDRATATIARACRVDARPASRMAQVLQRPDWLWDVAVHGRPHDLGNLEPIVGSGARAGRLHGVGSRAISTPASPGRTSSGSARNGRGRWSSRASSIPTTRARRRPAAPTASSFPTMAGASSTASLSTARALPRDRRGGRRADPSSPTAASARGSTWCGCSRSAPTSCCWPRLGLCARRARARRASRMC